MRPSHDHHPTPVLDCGELATIQPWRVKHAASRWRGWLAAASVALLLGASLLWLLRAAPAGAGVAADALAGTITVCSSGCMYTSIQTALENSITGTTILVGPGEYPESIWMRGGVRIQGAGPGRSFIIWSGQAPAVVGYPHDLANAVLDGFTIVCNSPSSAIHIDGLHEKQIISNNVISNSVGEWHSGGIFIVDGATPTIINNVFVYNTLTLGDGGGAIYVEDAAPIITGNTFIGNSAKNGGAIAVFNEDTYKATITNNTFTGNTAQIGGGAIYVNHASPSIRDNQIYSNTALLGGGIGAIDHSSPLIQDNQIAYNRASGTGSVGGGIAILDAINPEVDRNVIRYNSAQEGGGIYVQSAAPRLTNNVLAGNHPNEILVNMASPRIANNTIAGTSNAGVVGIELLGSSWPTIANNIIAFEGYGIRGDGTALPTIRFNDAWMNSVANYSGVTAEPNNLNVNPGLRDAAHGDYHLQRESALVDAGATDDAPPFDFEGDVRPMDGDGDGIARPDIGADEYSGAPPARTRTPTPPSSSPTPAPSGTRTPTPSGTHTRTPTPIVMHTPTSTPTPGSEPLWRQEAEQGTIESPMTTGLDSAASNGQYVYSPQSYEGQVSVSFYVRDEADYEVWGRVSADSYSGDSFWVTVDGGAQATWDLPLGGWTWAPVTNRGSGNVALTQVYHLLPGWHQVSVYAREAGAKLDVLELRNATVTPTPSSSPPQPSATPTPTGTPTPTLTVTPTQPFIPTTTQTQTDTPTSTPTETNTPQSTFRVVLPLILKHLDGMQWPTPTDQNTAQP